ncbi:DUF3027 domain-containing protein [Microbacterium telephonicum]|uniref:DUF3027 family protein n=1 Tax=Microbacterium telephonicum TaxID=1714841 RepID=A0A498BTU5_9MICO|nr:DUF3027 domain-containing protein [Microbacterium telephonicum]RLK47384.1 hypothetical protein C7474_1961 [Microbacterium telephonicum]
MTSTPETPESLEAPDQRLLDAHDLARAALREITADATVGDVAGHSVEPDGVVSLRFHNRLPAYPGWFWTVSLAVVEDAEPTVLEVELLPGEGALLAPEWVPWAVRLADYQAAQAALAESADDEDADLDDDEGDDLDEADDDGDDLDDVDAEDFDEDGSPILHAGDLDGVDIDELDEDANDDTDDDTEDDDADADDDLDELDDDAEPDDTDDDEAGSDEE